MQFLDAIAFVYDTDLLFRALEEVWVLDVKVEVVVHETVVVVKKNLLSPFLKTDSLGVVGSD